MKIIVTRPSNVTETADGDIELNDDQDLGYVVQTHIFPFSYMNPETNELVSGVKSLMQVHWEMERTPAFTLEAPEDLYWLKFSDDEDDEDETDSEETPNEESDADEEDVEYEETVGHV